jgi:hypothetical protein
MMVMACEAGLRVVVYLKPPTAERRARRDFAEDAEKNPSAFAPSANPWRALRMEVHFSHGACRGTARIERLAGIREKSLK